MGSSAFYLSEGFIIGRASYCEEFILMLFIFDVFYQGIRPPGDKLRSQLTEAGGCKTSLQPEPTASCSYGSCISCKINIYCSKNRL